MHTTGQISHSRDQNKALLHTSGAVSLAHNQNKVLNFLPLAHTYGCTLDFLSQISNGSHITFLNKVPAPKVLIKAFDEVKPNVIFTVPLIVEKFYRAIAEPVMKKHAGISESVLEQDIYPQLCKISYPLDFQCAQQ